MRARMTEIRTVAAQVFLTFFAALALSGCGFEPMYARSSAGASPVAAELADVSIAPIADRRGQMLRQALEERLNAGGEPARPRYTLAVSLSESIEKLVFRRDASPTLANLSLVADYQLRPAGGDGPATSGRARTTISYNISRADFATLAAESDARERAVRELAIEITSRLASHFGQNAAKR
jgi:LPS-assembly lipoprotein